MMRSVLLVASLVSWDNPSGETGAEIEARWRREYPRAVAVLERNLQDYHAKGRYTYRWLSGQTVTTGRLAVASSGASRLIAREQRTTESSTAPKRPYKSDVRSMTPEYEFKLIKEFESSPYIISSYHEKSAKEDINFKVDYDLLALGATTYMNDTLLNRMQSPTFVVKAAENLRLDGDDVVRIDYTYQGEYASHSGAVYLDPGRGWVIRKVEVDTKSKAFPRYDFRSRVDYEGVGGNVFLPKRLEFVSKTDRPDVYDSAVVEFDQITAGNVPTEIFKLTAYGLPDVPLRAVSPPSIFSWRNPLVWGSLAMAVISFIVLRVLRPRTGNDSSRSVP